MQLDSFVTLREANDHASSLATAGCERLFDDIISKDDSLSRFAHSLTQRRRKCVNRRTAFPVRSFAAKISDAADWAVLGDQSTGEARSLEIIGCLHVGGAAYPVVLAMPTPYLSASPLRTDCDVHGTAGIALRAAQVSCVYTLLLSPGHALFLCVHGGGGADGERLKELCSCKSRNPSAATLVYCAVQCEDNEWWKLSGFPTELLAELYLGKLRDGTLRSVTDASAASLDVWQFLRCVLPIVHLNVRKAFRNEVMLVPDTPNRGAISSSDSSLLVTDVGFIQVGA